MEKIAVIFGMPQSYAINFKEVNQAEMETQVTQSYVSLLCCVQPQIAINYHYI
jgi:hypothetical protein